MKKVFSILILCILCVFTMVGCGKSDQDFYNEGVKVLYERVDKNLIYALNRHTFYSALDSNIKLNTIRFKEASEENVELEIFFEGDIYNSVWEKNFSYYASATFNSFLQYDNSLIEAKSSQNVIKYLDTLNEIFTNMEYVKSENHDEIAFLKNVEKTEENYKKINELLKLDFTDDDIIRQVGFVPYNIEIVKWEGDTINKIVNYTYKIRGISYCEVKSEHTEIIKENENLVIETNYDEKHIKAFYRDIEYSCYRDYTIAEPDKLERLSYDFKIYCKDVNNNFNDFDVKTTYFQETNVFDEFLTMRETSDFNYKMPEDFTFQREILGVYKFKSAMGYDKKYYVGDVVENERLTEDFITLTVYICGQDKYYVEYREQGRLLSKDYYLIQKDGNMYLVRTKNGEIQGNANRVVIEKGVLTIYDGEDVSAQNEQMVLVKK